MTLLSFGSGGAAASCAKTEKSVAFDVDHGDTALPSLTNETTSAGRMSCMYLPVHSNAKWGESAGCLDGHHAVPNIGVCSAVRWNTACAVMIRVRVSAENV